MNIAARFVLLICLVCLLNVYLEGPAGGVSGAINSLG
jgi:hypothetical protein